MADWSGEDSSSVIPFRSFLRTGISVPSDSVADHPLLKLSPIRTDFALAGMEKTRVFAVSRAMGSGISCFPSNAVIRLLKEGFIETKSLGFMNEGPSRYHHIRWICRWRAKNQQDPGVRVIDRVEGGRMERGAAQRRNRFIPILKSNAIDAWRIQLNVVEVCIRHDNNGTISGLRTQRFNPYRCFVGCIFLLRRDGKGNPRPGIEVNFEKKIYASGSTGRAGCHRIARSPRNGSDFRRVLERQVKIYEAMGVAPPKIASSCVSGI